MGQKENKVDHQTNHQKRKNHQLEQIQRPTPKAKAKANPKHDIETTNNDDPEFWKKQNLGLTKSQLGKRDFKKTQKS